MMSLEGKNAGYMFPVHKSFFEGFITANTSQGQSGPVSIQNSSNIGWGGLNNLPIENMTKLLVHDSGHRPNPMIPNLNGSQLTLDTEKKLMFPYGYCYFVEDLSSHKEIISNHKEIISNMQIFIELGNKTNFELFLTDANRATAYSFDWQSFVTELSWEKQSTPVGIVYEVSMKRTVLDKDDPNTTCTDYGAAGAKYTTYEKCMEEEQYIRFQSIFGCMHPLLTNNVSRACPSKVNNPDIPAYIDYLNEYLFLNMKYKQSKTIP